MSKPKKRKQDAGENVDDFDTRLEHYLDEDETEDFWESLEGDIAGAQKKAVELLVNPKGIAKYTLSDLTNSEIRSLATLKAISELIPDPILVNFIRNYVVMKRSRNRRGVKELIAIVGGRAWRILQSVSLSRLRKVQEYSETGGEEEM